MVKDLEPRGDLMWVLVQSDELTEEALHGAPVPDAGPLCQALLDTCPGFPAAVS